MFVFALNTDIWRQFTQSTFEATKPNDGGSVIKYLFEG